MKYPSPINIGYPSPISGNLNWTPLSLNWNVYVDATTGFYDAASGGNIVSTNGTVVNGWVNNGSLGGRLGKLSDKNGPLYRPNSGNPYLEFDASGTDGYALGIDTGADGSGSLTIHVLVRHNRAASGFQLDDNVWCLRGGASGDSGRLACRLTDRDKGGCNVGVDTADGPVYNTEPCVEAILDKKWHLLTCRRQAGSPSTWTVWVDGVKIYTGTTATTATGCDRFNIGGPMYGEGFAGDVAFAACARTTAHTDAEITRVWEWFRDNHPLLARPTKVMVWAGDSTGTWNNAYAHGASGTWLPNRQLVYQVGNYLQTNNSLGWYYNHSVGGKATQYHIDNVSRLTGWLSLATTTPVLVISTGTNDIRPGGAGLTPAQSHAKIIELIEAVRSVVPATEVFVGTICDGDPATYGASFTANRNTLNGLIVSEAAGNDYTAVRVDQAVGIGEDYGAGTRDSTLFVPAPDLLHRNAGGMDAEAIVYQNAIGAVI